MTVPTGPDAAGGTTAAGEAPPLVVLEELLHAGDPDEVVIVLDGVGHRRRDLTASSDELTALASAAGVGPGVVVASCLPGDVSAVVAVFGGWRSGAACAPLNPRLTTAELQSMVDELEPGVVLVAAGDPRVDQAFAGRTVLEVDAELHWRLGRRGAAPPRTTVDGDTALVLYTSGTTARPKPVLLRRSTLTAAMSTVVRSIRTAAPTLTTAGAGAPGVAAPGAPSSGAPAPRVAAPGASAPGAPGPSVAAPSIAASGAPSSGAPAPGGPAPGAPAPVASGAAGGPGPASGPPAAEGKPARPPMPNIVAFPLYLWSGIYNVCFALLQHSLVVALSTFEPRALAAAIREHGVRSVVLAPAMVAALVDSDVEDLAPLRFVRNGTAALAPTVAERFENRYGVTLLNGYGQTELGGEVAGWSVPDIREFGPHKRGAAGRAHPGIVIRVLDDDGRELPAGEDGEVVVRSPFAMAGYLGRTDPARVTADGFIRTGDIGHLDADGFLWLTGRRSDVINRSGLKVYPDQVEDVLRTDPAVADVAVVGRVDERVGEIPWAFVVVRPGTEPSADLEARLAGRARERLAAYKVPAGFTYIDALPRNDIGKVLRRVLAADLRAAERDGSAGPDEPAP